MNMRGKVSGLILLTTSMLAAGCGNPEPPAPPALSAPQVQEITSPAGAFSREPNLTVGSGGELYLSWMEIGSAESPALKFATKTSEGWSEPRTIVQSDDLIVNYADFPSLLAYGQGLLAAHWLAVIPETEGYAVNIALSKDNGQTWSQPVVPHRDGTGTEHGFVSMVPATDGGVTAIWLDSRKFAGEVPSDETAMMYTKIAADGSAGPEVEIDPRACECCQTSAVTVGGEVLAVYRDRSETEIRDISIVRFDGTQWSAPKPVAADNWEIYGCPINGPSIAAEGQNVAVAWFTAPNDMPRVNVAFSTDGGNTFSAPIQVDEGSPGGRVDVVMDSGNAIVSWLEQAPQGGEVRVRKVEQNGTRHPHAVVSTTSVSTSSGFPRMERSGTSMIVAWTDIDQDRVRTATITP